MSDLVVGCPTDPRIVMAITDVAQYAYLSKSDIEALGDELDTIRRDVEESRGAHDATYIRRTIAFQRTLELGARLLIAASRSKGGWILGTAALAFAKSVENMEIGHNVSHGQWDWMNDPEIHSPLGNGTWQACRHNGAILTTTVTTYSPTSWTWMTTSASA